MRLIRKITDNYRIFAAFYFQFPELILHLRVKLGLDVVVSQRHVGEGSCVVLAIDMVYLRLDNLCHLLNPILGAVT